MNFDLIPIAHAVTIGSIVDTIIDFLDSIIPILFLIATIVFLLGIILFITSLLYGEKEKKKKEGRQYIIFGLIVFFVMVAVWGIVNVFVVFFVLGGIGAPSLPD